jgi:hypothetical protein
MAAVDQTRTLVTTLDSNSSNRVEEHTLAKLPLTTHRAQLLRLHQHLLLLERILTARLRQASMALNTNLGRVSLTAPTSSKAPSIPTMRTSNNLVVVNIMVTSSILAQPSNTARISNSTVPILPMEAINSSQVRTSSMVETLLEGARTCRTTTRSLLHLQGVRPSKDNMGNKDSSISPLLLDSNRSISRQVRVILILKPTEANSAVHLISMPNSPRATVRPQLVVPSSILLPHLEDLPEDTTIPTMGVMGTSSLLTVISRTTAAALLLFLTEATLNNNMGDLTEGLTRSCTEKLQTHIFSPVVKRIWSFLIRDRESSSNRPFRGVSFATYMHSTTACSIWQCLSTRIHRIEYRHQGLYRAENEVTGRRVMRNMINVDSRMHFTSPLLCRRHHNY